MYGILSRLPPEIVERVFEHLEPIDVQYLHSDAFLRPYALNRMYEEPRVFPESSHFQEMRTQFYEDPSFNGETLSRFVLGGYIKPKKIHVHLKVIPEWTKALECVENIFYYESPPAWVVDEDSEFENDMGEDVTEEENGNENEHESVNENEENGVGNENENHALNENEENGVGNENENHALNAFNQENENGTGNENTNEPNGTLNEETFNEPDLWNQITNNNEHVTQLQNDMKALGQLSNRPRISLTMHRVDLGSFEFPPNVVGLDAFEVDGQEFFGRLPPTLESLRIPAAGDLVHNIPELLTRLEISIPPHVSWDLAYLTKVTSLTVFETILDVNAAVLPPNVRELEFESCAFGSVDYLALDKLQRVAIIECTGASNLRNKFPPSLQELRLDLYCNSVETHRMATLVRDHGPVDKTLALFADVEPTAPVETTREIRVMELTVPDAVRVLHLRLVGAYLERPLFKFPGALRELQVMFNCLGYDNSWDMSILDESTCIVEFPKTLEKLECSRCPYISVVSNIAELNLRYLDVSKLSAFFTDVKDIPQSLEELILGYGKITHLDVSHLPNLNHLHLVGNRVESIDDLKWGPAMSTVCLDSNRISRLDGSYNISELSVRGNRISYIGPEFRHSHMVELDIGANELDLDLQTLPETLVTLHATLMHAILGQPHEMLSTASFCSKSEVRVPHWDKVLAEAPQLEGAFVEEFSKHYEMGVFYSMTTPANERVVVVVEESVVRVYAETGVDKRAWVIDINTINTDEVSVDEC